MSALTYKFEELPTIVEGGFRAAEVTGEAHITYDRDGVWTIDEISLEACKRAVSTSDIKQHGCWIRKQLKLCRQTHSQLYLAIIDRLETDKGEDIQYLVDEELAHQGIRVAEFA
jgi:hypothetical protein